MLFLTFVNDMPDAALPLGVLMFGDDANLFNSHAGICCVVINKYLLLGCS